MTPEEAQKAYDEAEPIPLSPERIKEILEFAVSTCPRCEGTGKYRRLFFQETDCAVCNGTGKIGPDGRGADEGGKENG